MTTFNGKAVFQRGGSSAGRGDNPHNTPQKQSSVSKYACPECNKSFTNAEEYAYGHDCES
jgi:transposase-like protein